MFLYTHSYLFPPLITLLKSSTVFPKKRFKMSGIVINQVFLISVTISMVLANQPELGKHCQQNFKGVFRLIFIGPESRIGGSGLFCCLVKFSLKQRSKFKTIMHCNVPFGHAIKLQFHEKLVKFSLKFFI